MNSLSGFLLKFKKIIGDKGSEIAFIRETIRRIAGIEVSPEAIQVREEFFYLQIGPIQRTEITFRKKEILSALQAEGVLMKDFR